MDVENMWKTIKELLDAHEALVVAAEDFLNGGMSVKRYEDVIKALKKSRELIDARED